nr:GNAT family N-acetyltransferase [Micromonospora okii]
MLDRRLYLHLATWLGQWPAGTGLHVVRSHRRVLPAWDGRLRPAIAVGDGRGTVLSVAPRHVPAVRALAGRSGLIAGLPAAVDHPDWVCHTDVFRWTLAPAPLPDVGEWTAPTGPGLPRWLRLFREVLLVRDADGRYLAAAAIKRHDAHGRELAVGTAPDARGRGLARRLVAQAARRVLAEGAVPTYRHDPANVASARVAEAAGFADRGWRSYGVYPP